MDQTSKPASPAPHPPVRPDSPKGPAKRPAFSAPTGTPHARPDARTHAPAGHIPARPSKHATNHHLFTQAKRAQHRPGVLQRTPGRLIPRIRIDVGQVNLAAPAGPASAAAPAASPT